MPFFPMELWASECELRLIGGPPSKRSARERLQALSCGVFSRWRSKNRMEVNVFVFFHGEPGNMVGLVCLFFWGGHRDPWRLVSLAFPSRSCQNSPPFTCPLVPRGSNRVLSTVGQNAEDSRGKPRHAQTLACGRAYLMSGFGMK